MKTIFLVTLILVSINGFAQHGYGGGLNPTDNTIFGNRVNYSSNTSLPDDKLRLEKFEKSNIGKEISFFFTNNYDRSILDIRLLNGLELGDTGILRDAYISRRNKYSDVYILVYNIELQEQTITVAIDLFAKDINFINYLDQEIRSFN